MCNSEHHVAKTSQGITLDSHFADVFHSNIKENLKPLLTANLIVLNLPHCSHVSQSSKTSRAIVAAASF